MHPSTHAAIYVCTHPPGPRILARPSLRLHSCSVPQALQEEIGRAALQDQVRREALRAAAHGDRGSARRIMGEVQNKGVPGTGSAPMRGASKAGKKASERRLKEAREAEEFLNQMR